MLSDAVPNLLIGLREGLEAGLVVSILLAAVHKSPLSDGARRPSAPVWLGLLGALTVSASFATVLSATTSSLGGVGQDIVGGLLSILAVVLVTAMIFWMSRTAAHLSGELSGKVAEALMLGSGALALTAFLAVAREGAETVIFLYGLAQSGDMSGLAIGAVAERHRGSDTRGRIDSTPVGSRVPQRSDVRVPVGTRPRTRRTEAIPAAHDAAAEVGKSLRCAWRGSRKTVSRSGQHSASMI